MSLIPRGLRIALLALLFCSSMAVARANYEPAPAKIIEEVSGNGLFVAKSFPKSRTEEVHTIVFEKIDGQLKEVWRVAKYYEWLRVSEEGESIVAIGWMSQKVNEGAKLTLFFFTHGQLKRTYNIEDLFLFSEIYQELQPLAYLTGPRALVSVESSVPNGFYGDLFRLTFGDKASYVFSLPAGCIEKVSIDSRAKAVR